LTNAARGRLAVAGALAAIALPAVHARPADAASSQAVADTPTLTVPASPTTPPPQHFLNAVQATRIASASPKLQAELAKHRKTTHRAYAKGSSRWQVSWYDSHRNEIGQVIVDERSRSAVEVWTGPQAAWEMARGLPGAFGRKVNSPLVWIPLMVAFFAAFFDWRHPFRMLHLDLLVLLSFSFSHIFFNRGEIDTSVPLVYPVLAYLLVRTLWIAYARRPPRRAWRPLVPAGWLVLALIFLVGFRIGLNITNSNVIDVGYSGVIGADRITHGEEVYGNFPANDPSGDTYGPVNYYAYVPFELAFPWSGRWDDLPAAHAAALFFDLATVAALFWLGRRLRRGREGNALGIMLAFAWASYPYTLFVSNSNANDSLVALLVVLSFGALAAPRARGALLALAGAAKFAPLALAPLFASYDRRRLRDAALFSVALAAVTVVVYAVVFPHGGISELWNRTVGFQLGRDSPFSIWGLHPTLRWLQTVLKVAAVLLAISVALVPRTKTPLQLAALGAAVLIALQITISHWFYLYIVWWFPLVMVALLLRELPVTEAIGVGQRRMV
jgi:hypothetical protein